METFGACDVIGQAIGQQVDEQASNMASCALETVIMRQVIGKHGRHISTVRCP